jgi:hypothetical protein
MPEAVPPQLTQPVSSSPPPTVASSPSIGRIRREHLVKGKSIKEIAA